MLVFITCFPQDEESLTHYLRQQPQTSRPSSPNLCWRKPRSLSDEHSTNDEPVVNEGTQVYQYFQLVQNELGTPKVVICPDDKKRTVAINFINFSNNNISYFIGLDANETESQSLLSGDRNITNGFSARNGILDLTTNQMAGFTDEIHKKQGNIALSDGSVQQVSSARLRSEIIKNAPFATNRIKLP